jgi:hypothetical protein
VIKAIFWPCYVKASVLKDLYGLLHAGKMGQKAIPAGTESSIGGRGRAGHGGKLRRMRQEELGPHKFEVSLDYKVKPCLKKQKYSK